MGQNLHLHAPNMVPSVGDTVNKWHGLRPAQLIAQNDP